MSRLNLRKTLLPATKVWKSFTSTVQTKLHKLKKSKPIKKTTKHLNTTFAIVFNRSKPPLERPFRIRLKKQSLTRTPPSSLRIRHHNHCLRRGYAPVYVDELFVGPVVGQVRQPEYVANNMIDDKGKPNQAIIQVQDKKNKMDESSSSNIVKLEGVDEKAEEFIARFKQEMKLQRQRSFGEYLEMLARGV